MKKIAYHILRYIYLILGLMPIVAILFFIYLSHNCPKDYTNATFLWLKGADPLLSFNMISAIGIGVLLGLSAFMVFIGKYRWLSFFAFACILFVSRMVYGLCSTEWSWEHIGRAIIVYTLISIIAITHCIKNYNKKKEASPNLGKHNKVKKTFIWGLLLLLASLVFSYIMTIHRELIFRPQYYGDWFSSFFIIFDLNFLKAYLSDPLGLFLFLITLACLLAGCLLILGTIFIEDFNTKMNKRFFKKKKTHKIRKHSKLILRIVGVTLVLIGVGISCFWYFWLLPMCQRHDYIWNEQFSKKGHWEYVQNYIHRYGWTHDDSYMVGYLGNKIWAEWILAKSLDVAWLYGYGHKHIALYEITNQDPANSREYDPGIHEYLYREKKWAKWWEQNKNKSQIDWIQEGFAKYGFKVSKTPTVEEYKSLLTVLGDVREEKKYSSTENNEDKKDDTPLFAEIPEKDKEKEYPSRHIRYNAFRWLRDSGFKPVEFTINHVTKSSSKEIIQGLKEYQSWNSMYPWHADVGILPLPGRKKFPSDDGDYPRPAFFSTWIQVSGHCFMILPIVIGIFLLFWSSRKKKESK